MGWLDNLSDETRMELERHSKVAAIASLAPGFVSYAAKLDAEDAAFDIEARARGYVPEKTCQIVNKYEGHASTHLRMLGRCSSCGEVIETTHKFCFECGCKVVG